MEATVLQDQIGIGFLSVWIIQRLKTAKSIPWIHESSDTLNRWLSALAAAVATVGITWQYNPDSGVLTLTGLTLTSVLSFLWTLLSQGAIQQGIYAAIKKPKSNGA